MTKMRAMVVLRPGAAVSLVERDMPVPDRHEVLVNVQACGVCHSDVVTVQGLFPGIEYPRIPGHEVIGTVSTSTLVRPSARMKAMPLVPISSMEVDTSPELLETPALLKRITVPATM